MVAIGSCDYCDEFCAQLSVISPEAFELRSGWVPHGTIRQHQALVDRRLQCSIQDGYEYIPAHVGPMHGRRGERIDECRNCRSSSGMDGGGWDTRLDHSRCLTCWAGQKVSTLLLRRPASFAERDGIDEVEDGLVALDHTDPADRASVAAAFAAYVGGEAPPIRWVDSPRALIEAFEAAAKSAHPSLELASDEAPPWALRALDRENQLTDADADDEEEVRLDVDATAFAIARTIAMEKRRRDVALLARLLTDAGQFATEPATGIDDADPSGKNGARLPRLLRVLRRTSGPVVTLPGEIAACERPLALHLDPEGRPHAEDGPAIAWPDGFVVHALHGIAVPASVVMEPETIILQSIDAEPNLEVRRVLIERFGIDRLISEGKAKLVHVDDTGRLWRRPGGPLPPRPVRTSTWAAPESTRSWLRRLDAWVAVVEVENATTEPDGTRKRYFLRVPPTMETAREAVAWTFGMDGESYRPDQET